MLHPVTSIWFVHFAMQLLSWAEAPAQLEVDSTDEEMPWQAAMAELVLLVTTLSAESDGAAAVEDVLPAVLLTGSNAAEDLAKK